MTLEKPKLKMRYHNIRKRIGLDRTKVEEFQLIFKFDTEKEREAFKEDVKKWYYAEETPAKKKTGRPIASLFDVIGGTSTGAIGVFALSVLGKNSQPKFGTVIPS